MKTISILAFMMIAVPAYSAQCIKNVRVNSKLISKETSKGLIAFQLKDRNGKKAVIKFDLTPNTYEAEIIKSFEQAYIAGKNLKLCLRKSSRSLVMSDSSGFAIRLSSLKIKSSSIQKVQIY